MFNDNCPICLSKNKGKAELPPKTDPTAEIDAATDRVKISRAMPGWGEEVWQDGRIQNGECP